MSIFSEKVWEADEVGDKLCKQLFRRISKKVNKNRSSNPRINTEVLKNKLTKEENEKSPRVLNQETNDTDNSKKVGKKRKHKTKKDQNKNTKKSKLESPLINHKNTDIVDETKKKVKKNVQIRHQSIGKKSKNVDNSHGNIDLNRIQQMLMKKTRKSQIHEPQTLRERMMTQLRASRFRFLNETLYNNESSESRKMFKEDPDAFNAYHTGYRQQVEQWPLNPLDVIITSIKKMPKDHIIADFGCGEARLADSVEQKVHSLDLVAINDKVTACDVAHTQLLTESVHVVVFCLSLMGSNLTDYLLEANRVLKNNGTLKIADIESRFENIDEFIDSMKSYGFKNTWRDLSNNLFYFMDFKKVAEVNRRTKNLPNITLKSCQYKKR